MTEIEKRLILFWPLFLSTAAIYGYGLNRLHFSLTRGSFFFYLVLLTIGTFIWLKPVIKEINGRVLKRLCWVFLPSLALLATLAVGFHGYITPPNNHDASNHYFMISRIFQTGSVAYEKIFSGYSQTDWYPLGLHFFIAGLLKIWPGLQLTQTVFPVVWVIIAIYPLSVYWAAYQISRRQRLSLIASWLAFGYAMFPVNVLDWGGWPFIMGITLLWFALGQWLRLVNKPSFSNSLIFWLLIAGIFFIHTTELIWLGFILLPWIGFNWAKFLILIRSSVFWLPGFITIIFTYPFFHQGTASAAVITPEAQNITHTSLAESIQVLWKINFNINQSWLYTGWFLLGFWLALRRHKYYPLLIGLGIIYLIWLLRMTSGYTDFINQRLFPLFEPDRVLAYAGAYLSILGAYAIEFSSPVIINQLYLAKNPKLTVMITLTLITLVWPWWLNYRHLQLFLTLDTTVTAQDIALFTRNQTRCHQYLNDGYADAGRFIPYFSTSRILLDGPIEIKTDQTFFQQLQALKTPIQTQSLCASLPKLGWDCVYVGGKDTRKNIKSLNSADLSQNRYLEPVDSAGKSSIWRLKCPAS